MLPLKYFRHLIFGICHGGTYCDCSGYDFTSGVGATHNVTFNQSGFIENDTQPHKNQLQWQFFCITCLYHVHSMILWFCKYMYLSLLQIMRWPNHREFIIFTSFPWNTDYSSVKICKQHLYQATRVLNQCLLGI